MTEVVELKTDQIWKEVDPRFERHVRIEGVRAGRRGVQIRSVARVGSGWMEVPRSRVSYADHERFNGKRGGYEFVETSLS